MKRFAFALALIALSAASSLARGLEGIQDKTSPLSAGGISSGGGGHRSLLIYSAATSGASMEKSSNQCVGFSERAEYGLKVLRMLVRQGESFKDSQGQSVTLTEQDIDIAERILKEVFSTQERFILNVNLTDPDTHEPLTARNWANGVIECNPAEWNNIYKQYPHELARKVQRAISVHEVLSLPPLKLESTGKYPFSSAVLKSELPVTQLVDFDLEGFEKNLAITLRKGRKAFVQKVADRQRTRITDSETPEVTEVDDIQELN